MWLLMNMWILNEQIIASENQPVRWTTPLGLPVVQPYRKFGRHIVSMKILLNHKDHQYNYDIHKVKRLFQLIKLLLCWLTTDQNFPSSFDITARNRNSMCLNLLIFCFTFCIHDVHASDSNVTHLVFLSACIYLFSEKTISLILIVAFVLKKPIPSLSIILKKIFPDVTCLTTIYEPSLELKREVRKFFLNLLMWNMTAPWSPFTGVENMWTKTNVHWKHVTKHGTIFFFLAKG